MTELERKALLGDLDAQKQCTEQGIILPCPFCGGAAFVKTLTQDYGFSGTSVTCLWCRARVYQLDKRVVITEDEAHNVPVENHKYMAIKQWNTRPAPPVGKCEDCRYFSKSACIKAIPHKITRVNKSFYCKDFKQKEPDHDTL